VIKKFPAMSWIAAACCAAAGNADGATRALAVAAPPCCMRASDPRQDHPAMPDPETERVLILDFGSQVTQLIARRVRELGWM
jgi:hypothetical protein